MKPFFKITLLLSAISLSFNPAAIACRCSFSETEIDSAVVKSYVFIALATITDVQDDKKPLEGAGNTLVGQLTIHIKELFKGDPVDQLFERDKNTSCDLGISTGEEWVLFGKLIRGNLIINREYSRLGKIVSEWLIDPDRDFVTYIYYHENGSQRSIGHTLKGVDVGRYQEYDPNGVPTKSWDYDENGRRFNVVIPESARNRLRR